MIISGIFFIPNTLGVFLKFSQTIVCFVMGGTVYWLMKKVGPDVAAYLDARRQVSGLFKELLYT